MNEDQAHSILKSYYSKLAGAIVRSFETYRTRYPHRPIHQRRTTANVMCDEIWAEIVNEFDEDAPRVRPIEQSYGLRLLGIAGANGEIEVLLWFKKFDRSKRPRSIMATGRSKRMFKGGTLEMFDKAAMLVVGYQLNLEETRIRGVSICQLLDGRPEWYIDLDLPEAPAKIVQLPDRSPQAPSGRRRVIVRRTSQKRLSNDS
jgi:hypothetical protein